MNIRLVFGACVMCLALGAFHAYSVLQAAVSEAFDTGAANASLGYSLALVGLTLGVVFGPRATASRSPRQVITAVLLGTTLACALAAQSVRIWQFWLLYGGLFGVVNGVGYGYSLQLAARAAPQRAGLALGMVNAAYSFGAALAPWWLQFALQQGGLGRALLAMGAVLLASAATNALLLRHNPRVDAPDSPPATADRAPPRVPLWQPAAGYGLAMFAGLLALGHATGIARQAGLAESVLMAAPALLACASLAGCLLGGVLCDRLGSHRALLISPLPATLGAAALALQGPVLVGLCLIGFGYGTAASTWPAALNAQHGAQHGSLIFSRIFIAWGLAGLLGPWIAGALLDWRGDYQLAVWLAGACALGSVLVVQRQHKELGPGPAAHLTRRRRQPAG